MDVPGPAERHYTRAGLNLQPPTGQFLRALPNPLGVIGAKPHRQKTNAEKKQTDHIITCQGILTDNNSNPLPNSSYSLDFAIYDDSILTGTHQLWTETQSVNTRSGLFSVALGSATSLKGLNFDKQYWLGVKRNGMELLPRLKLLCSP